MYRTIGIISRPRREEVAAVAPGLIKWLCDHGLKVSYDRETASCVSQPEAILSRDELAKVSDLLIVLGGDGTILAAARSLGANDVPILPINLGGLGFLTSVTQPEIYSILEPVLAGNSSVSERTLLEAEVFRGTQSLACHRALNDAVFNKGALARIVDLSLAINSEFVVDYKADGLIISTPTGSTAYSLSAGGPIVEPAVPAFVITPICPHTLTHRPLVIPESAEIEITLREAEEPVYLTLDGQVGVELHTADRTLIRATAPKLRLLRPAGKTYYEILRNKLKWGER
jgi:NAD+ kinase